MSCAFDTTSTWQGRPPLSQLRCDMTARWSHHMQVLSPSCCRPHVGLVFIQQVLSARLLCNQCCTICCVRGVTIAPSPASRLQVAIGHKRRGVKACSSRSLGFFRCSTNAWQPTFASASLSVHGAVVLMLAHCYSAYVHKGRMIFNSLLSIVLSIAYQTCARTHDKQP